jgi:hypothetical protein
MSAYESLSYPGQTNRLNYDVESRKSKQKLKEKKISDSQYNILQLMLIFIGVYLNCQVLKLSNLISGSSHIAPTVGLYAYDLLLTVLVTLPLVRMTDILGKTFNFFLYMLFCNLGGLGFALLGEVPFLHNIVIVKDFWKHLTPAAWGTVIFFASIIIGVGMREIRTSCRYNTFPRQTINYFCFILFYIGIFALLSGGGATGIHWHIHHAIFAGFLSLWFTNWGNTIEMIMHAIMMGIVIEGINFYGIQELYLFLSDDGSNVKMKYAFFISMCYLFGMIVFKLCSKRC